MIKLYIGKSGAGKDTIVKEVLSKNKDIHPIVSFTTRPKRPNEIDGIDYNFVDNATFEKLLNNNELTEYRVYDVLFNGVPEKCYYGTPILDSSQDYAGVVDIEGAYAFLEKYGSEDIDLIYVVVDNDNVRRERVERRGGVNKIEWERRFADDEVVFSEENLKKLCRLYGKPIPCIHNNDRLTFDEIKIEEV